MAMRLPILEDGNERYNGRLHLPSRRPLENNQSHMEHRDNGPRLAQNCEDYIRYRFEYEKNALVTFK